MMNCLKETKRVKSSQKLRHSNKQDVIVTTFIAVFED